MKKILSLLLVVVFVFSMASAPIEAAMFTRDVIMDPYMRYDPWLELVRRDEAEVARGGSTRGGGAGRRYYTQPTLDTGSGSGSGGGSSGGGGAGGRGSDVTYNYTSGSTVQVPIINTFNNTVNLPNINTTNNYNYYTYDYSTINYNTYNTTNNYSFYEVTVNHNYYTTVYEIYYNPTYVSVYYINAATGFSETHNYYYQLPDGRSSADLKAEDVWGLVTSYEFYNYDEVIEDTRTKALFHFDGDAYDSSAYDSYITYTKGVPSITYLQSAGEFGLGIYFDATSRKVLFNLRDPTLFKRSHTIEMRMYMTRPQISGNGGSSFIVYSGDDTWNTTEMLVGLYGKDGVPHFASREQFVNKLNYTPVPIGTWFTFAFTYDEPAATASYFINGKKMSSGIAPVFKDNVNYQLEITLAQAELYQMASQVDEVRISEGVLYTSDYTPASIPFDTNKVMVLPEGIDDEYSIAVRSTIPIVDYRVGGVRPTYPEKGFVYLYLDNDNKVKSTQIYDGADWMEVSGRIYLDGKWIELNEYVVDGPEEMPDPGDGGGGTDPGDGGGGTDPGDGGGGGGNDGDGVLSWLLKLVSGLFSGLGSILGMIIEGITSIIGIFTNLLGSLVGLGGGFTSFLAEALPFIPSEILSIITLGFTLMVVVSILKFIRG